MNIVKIIWYRMKGVLNRYHSFFFINTLSHFRCEIYTLYFYFSHVCHMRCICFHFKAFDFFLTQWFIHLPFFFFSHMTFNYIDECQLARLFFHVLFWSFSCRACFLFIKYYSHHVHTCLLPLTTCLLPLTIWLSNKAFLFLLDDVSDQMWSVCRPFVLFMIKE